MCAGVRACVRARESLRARRGLANNGPESGIGCQRLRNIGVFKKKRREHACAYKHAVDSHLFTGMRTCTASLMLTHIGMREGWSCHPEPTV